MLWAGGSDDGVPAEAGEDASSSRLILFGGFGFRFVLFRLIRIWLPLCERRFLVFLAINENRPSSR